MSWNSIVYLLFLYALIRNIVTLRILANVMAHKRTDELCEVGATSGSQYLIVFTY